MFNSKEVQSLFSNLSQAHLLNEIEMYGQPFQQGLLREEMEAGWDDWTFACGFTGEGELLGCRETGEVKVEKEKRFSYKKHVNSPEVFWEKTDRSSLFDEFKGGPNNFGTVAKSFLIIPDLEDGERFSSSDKDEEIEMIKQEKIKTNNLRWAWKQAHPESKSSSQRAALRRKIRTSELEAFLFGLKPEKKDSIPSLIRKRKGIEKLISGVKGRVSEAAPEVGMRKISTFQEVETKKWGKVDELKVTRRELGEIKLALLKSKRSKILKGQKKALEKHLGKLLSYKGKGEEIVVGRKEEYRLTERKEFVYSSLSLSPTGKTIFLRKKVAKTEKKQILVEEHWVGDWERLYLTSTQRRKVIGLAYKLRKEIKKAILALQK